MIMTNITQEHKNFLRSFVEAHTEDQFAIGGSVALTLMGYDLKRQCGDIDINVTDLFELKEVKNYTALIPNAFAKLYKKYQVNSEAPSKECLAYYFTNKKTGAVIKVDIVLEPVTKEDYFGELWWWEFLGEFSGAHSLRLTKLDRIIEAKERYLERFPNDKKMDKHRKDINLVKT